MKANIPRLPKYPKVRYIRHLSYGKPKLVLSQVLGIARQQLEQATLEELRLLFP